MELAVRRLHHGGSIDRAFFSMDCCLLLWRVPAIWDGELLVALLKTSKDWADLWNSVDLVRFFDTESIYGHSHVSLGLRFGVGLIHLGS